MIRTLIAASLFAVSSSLAAFSSDVTHTVVDFKDLQDWDKDDHEKALEAFLVTCPDLKDPDWSALCALAQQKPDAKGFFELFFRPVLIEDGDDALFTGYF